MSTLFTDTFDRANGAPGGNWTTVQEGSESDASWAIASNVLTTSVSSFGSHQVNSTALGTTDYECECTLVANGVNSGAGITGRFLDSANFYMLDTFQSHLRLYKKVGGSFTALGDYVAGTNNGTLKLSMQGTAINGWLNGVQQITATDGDLTAAGDFTCRNGFDSGHTWDNYTVYGFGVAVQLVRPASDVSAGSWTTDTGGTTSLYATVDETTASDTDYIQSGLGTSNFDEVKLRLQSFTLPTDTTGWELHWRYEKTPGSNSQTVNLRIRLYDTAGTGVIHETTVTGISGTVTQGTISISSGEAAIVTSGDTAAGLVIGILPVAA